ncbi:MAG: DUF2145 domain-containing protein [Burkholderiaceae bacterium]
MKRKFLLIVVAAAGAALYQPAAHAGRTCENKPMKVYAITQGMALAERTAKALDQSGAQVAILARAGQDLSAYGLRWSHLGLAYREAEGGPWRVLHKLNACGTDEASLYRQGLGEFFMDDPFEYRAAFVAVKPDLAAKLLPVLRDTASAQTMHTRRYNMLAYPWAQKYQQSNQWALETFAYAQNAVVPTRAGAQGWLMSQGYAPTTLRLGAFTRLGARATRANVAFDDHPNEKRFSDRIETVTVESIFAFFDQRQFAAAPITVR